jgi:hypothetical protein
VVNNLYVTVQKEVFFLYETYVTLAGFELLKEVIMGYNIE